MKKFVKDKNFLLKYFIGNIVVFSTLIGVLLLSKQISFAPKLGLMPLLLVPLGVIWGLVVSTAFHNASHKNIKPLWLNELVGELAGAYTLEGMRNFSVGQMLHHMHSDDL
jgi:stearoyl-CoA desaturase (delta-9 desaturase)